MRIRCLALAAVATALLAQTGLVADGQPPKTPRDALQPFNDLIGSWCSTATPNGTKEDQLRNFWVETIAWEWQFKDKDAWLTVAFDKSKHFTKGTLRYVQEQDHLVQTLVPLIKEELTFTGHPKDKLLTLDSEQHATMD